MKIRNGFVSNSSSSSFCICKNLMTEQQIKEFKAFLENRTFVDDEYYETSVGEDGKYFVGEADMHDRPFWDFVHKNFKREDYADYC